MSSTIVVAVTLVIVFALAGLLAWREHRRARDHEADALERIVAALEQLAEKL